MDTGFQQTVCKQSGCELYLRLSHHSSTGTFPAKRFGETATNACTYGSLTTLCSKPSTRSASHQGNSTGARSTRRTSSSKRSWSKQDGAGQSQKPGAGKGHCHCGYVRQVSRCQQFERVLGQSDSREKCDPRNSSFPLRRLALL